MLVVDDEAIIARLIQRSLEHLGYTVTAQSGSVEALGLFKNDPAHFDLVITDLSMPKMTGDALATEILSLRPDIPIILASGLADSLTPETIGTIGIRAVIRKPFERLEMAALVRRMLDESRENDYASS
jgi:CheY-like chemotaxis protein